MIINGIGNRSKCQQSTQEKQDIPLIGTRAFTWETGEAKNMVFQGDKRDIFQESEAAAFESIPGVGNSLAEGREDGWSMEEALRWHCKSIKHMRGFGVTRQLRG